MPARRTAAVTAVIAVAGLVCAPASLAARMTHKVSIDVKFVNHWTVDDNQECGPVGDGTLTVKLGTTRATRVLPYVDSYAGGGWNVGVPHGYKGRLIKAMEWAKAGGTITREDNTTPKPDPNSDEPCAPLSKRGCGTFSLPKRDSAAYVYGGHRPKRISVHARTSLMAGDCLIGDARRLDDTRALVGGNREGNVLVKMPKPSAFKRRVVRIRARTHKRSSFGGPGEGSSTNDITREVTVTFRRL